MLGLKHAWRIWVMMAIISFFAVVIIGKLYLIQIANAEKYREKANKQYFGSTPSESISRGTIFFRSKDNSLVSAATLRTGYTLAISPPTVTDANKIYESINAVVPINADDFFAKAGKSDDPYEVIANHVSEDNARALKEENLQGIILSDERWRYYPGDSLGAHAVGLIAYREDELAGRYGLERYYEDTLNRKGEKLYKNFFAEIFTNIKKSVSSADNHRGDIITTIEPSAQISLQKALQAVQNKWDSKTSGGIVINPKNGEIYAMAIEPTFNPNDLSAVRDATIFSNPIIEDVFEMGSIIKPLTIAAAMDAGFITASTTYNDRGFLVIDESRISNFDGKGRGIVSMQEVLSQSLNTGVAYAVTKMGKDIFRDYLKKLEIGEETGIDLPNEAHGLIANLDSPRDIEYATASYGQGIALTPIATVRALSTLANDGKLPNPHLVSKINYSIGFSKATSFPEGKQVIKGETAKEITRMLVEVVDTALKNGEVKMEHYSIAAKTGTAQVPKKDKKGYEENIFFHSFFGYFPAFDPKFLVFLYTMDPKARYASETLTDPFIDLTNFLINYYEIPPDR